MSPITAKTREILTRHGIHLKKSLGQHFLTDQQILDKMMEAAELDERTGVLEIGPGVGALTERLARVAKQVVTVELDDRLIPVLQELFNGQPHVSIIHGDALEVDLNALIRDKLGTAPLPRVVANLPYYVTSPIIMRLLEERLPLSHIVVMIQKEVAERLTAKPGTKAYGSITVTTQYYAEPEWVCRVPAHVFIPRPQVDSAVVRLKVRDRPPVTVKQEDLLFRVIRAAFNQRRKTLSNALMPLMPAGQGKEGIVHALQAAAIDPRRRGETLSLEEFARLTDQLDRWLSHHIS